MSMQPRVRETRPIRILEEMKALTGKRYNLSRHIAAIYAALGK